MKKALLLHGWEGTSDGCWFPWLKKELEKRGYKVFLPDLPHTNEPIFEEQIDCIKDFSKRLWKWDIIVGHSLWSTLSTQTIEKYKLQDIQVILVAPTYPAIWKELQEKLGKYYDILNPYYTLKNTFEKLDNSYTILLSDNDPFIDAESAQQYYNYFWQENKNSVEYVLLTNRYHFSDGAPDPIKEIPEILTYI